ncbi:MAG TPA: hypothetical protein DC047_11300 [Blastocatellia bacterium]|nr:hypothetical protein [Blastocatellia bacterium]
MPTRVSVPKSVKRAVRERDRNICQICRKRFDAVFLDYDHIHPYSQGGSNDVDNIRLVCKKCNSVKRDQIHCPQCGAYNKPIATYCQACGVRLRRNRNRERPAFLFGLSLRQLVGLAILLWIILSLLGMCGTYSLVTRPSNSTTERTVP